MVYLQVRDFPEELHEQLKLCAKREYRSVSQQTIIAIKEHLERSSQEATTVEQTKNSLPQKEQLGADYLTKRKMVLERIEALPKLKRNFDSEEIVGVLRKGREERDARIGL